MANASKATTKEAPTKGPRSSARVRAEEQKKAKEAEESKAAQQRLEEAMKKAEEEKKKKKQEEAKKRKEAEEAAKKEAEEKKKQEEADAARKKEQEKKEAAVKREAEKKERAEERRRVEAEERRQADAAAKAAKEAKANATAADAADGPNPSINDFLGDIQSGTPGDSEEDDMGTETERDEERSPRKKRMKKGKKKKSRKERKSARKEKNKKEGGNSNGKGDASNGGGNVSNGGGDANDGGGNEGDGGNGGDGGDGGDGYTTDPETRSNLRSGKFSTAGSTPGRKATVAVKPPHDHEHKRTFVEASRRLVEEDKRAEFPMAVRGLVKECQKVDPHFVMVPIKEGVETPVITTPSEIPLNYTDLGLNVRLSKNANFQKKRPWGAEGEVSEEDMVDPEVYFTFVISCDVEPEEILDLVREEWRRTGGNRLELKDLRTHDVRSALVLYHMDTGGHQPSIIAECTEMLKMARDEEDLNNMDFEWGSAPIPDMAMRLMVPKAPGQDTRKMEKMPSKMKHARKALHIDVAAQHVKLVQALMRIAKDRRIVEKFWGYQVRPTDVISMDRKGKEKSRSWEIENVLSFTKRHVNLQMSMASVGLVGFLTIDVEVPIYSVSEPERKVGDISMRRALYDWVKLMDGHTLFSEVHQEMAMSEVEAVVPNNDAADLMVRMMNKNVVAFFKFYLKDKGMPEELIERLLTASCDSSLFHEATQCTWNSETMELKTPKDAEANKRKAIEEAAWYTDHFGEFMSGGDKKGGKAGKTYTAPEYMYDLDGDHSVKTMSGGKIKTNRYEGSPGAPTFQVGGKARQEEDGKEEGKDEVIDVDADVDDISHLSEMSKDELLKLSKELLRKTRVSTKPPGSAPGKSDDQGSPSDSDSEVDSSSTGDGSDSVSGSSVESGSSMDDEEPAEGEKGAHGG